MGPAFAGIVARATVMVLLSYHFGDDVAMALYFHGLTNVVMLLFVLLLLFALDSLLERVLRPRGPSPQTPAPAS